jgi:hypothetical protein
MRYGPSFDVGSKRLVLLALVAGIIFVSLIRYAQFSELDPRMDQASFAVWVQDLIEAPRLLPNTADETGFKEALIRDENSALNILLRRLYVVHDHIFVVLSLAWFTAWTTVFGWDMPGQVAISIISGTLAAAVIAWLPWVRGGENQRRSIALAPWITAAIFAFASANGFLGLFSALGVHNVGLLGLACGLVATQSWLWRWQDDRQLWPGWIGIFSLVGPQAVAFYTHYTSVFLLPMATAVVLAASTIRPVSARWRAVLSYAGAGLLTAIPFFALTLIARPEIDTDQDALSRLAWVLSQDGYSPAELWLRVSRWWTTMADYSTSAGLAMGLGGCIVLAFKEKAFLPLSLISVHLLISVMIPGFSQLDRTGSYAVLVLCMGAGWLVVVSVDVAIAAWRNHGRPRAVGIFVGLTLLVAGQFGIEAERLTNPASVSSWSYLLHYPGEDRRLVRTVEKAMPEGSLFFAWDYRLEYAIRVLSERLRGETRTLRPVESYIREHEAGRLNRYTKKHGMHLPSGTPIYLLVPDRFESRLRAMAGPVFGPGGLEIRTDVKLQRVKTLNWKHGLPPSDEYGLYVIP